MPVEQKVQANFKVVPYDGSVHREAVVKLLGLQSIFSREGLSSCVPFYYCVCINEKGVVIGAMGLWGAESCVAHLDCFAVHEQYQRQGVEEKLLEYHLKKIFSDLGGTREQISLMIGGQHGFSTRTALADIEFELHGYQSGLHEYIMTREIYNQKFSIVPSSEAKESV